MSGSVGGAYFELFRVWLSNLNCLKEEGVFILDGHLWLLPQLGDIGWTLIVNQPLSPDIFPLQAALLAGTGPEYSH